MKGYLIEDEDLEIAMKVIIVGNGSVGKSSMIQRFCRGVFTRDYKKTIGVDFLERVITIDGHNIRLMLWDTAGQEEFDAITRTYYRGASACVLACSITDRNSFNALPAWKTKVCRECGDDVPMILVANKFDLQKQAVVDSPSLEAMARSLGVTKLLKTSVKEDLNILAVFTHLAQEYLTSVLALDDMTSSTDLIEGDAFLSSIDSHNLVDGNDQPHHKFHTPIFGHFRTYNDHNAPKNNKNTSNKGNKLKLMKPKAQRSGEIKPLMSLSPLFLCGNGNRNPVILKPHHESFEPIGELPLKKDFLSSPSPKSNTNYKNLSNNEQSHLSANGNHYTHWDNNMPFRLDAANTGSHVRKQKKELCNIL